MDCAQPRERSSGNSARACSRGAPHPRAYRRETKLRLVESIAFRRRFDGRAGRWGLAIGAAALANEKLVAADGTFPRIVAELREDVLAEEPVARNARELLFFAVGTPQSSSHVFS